MEGGGEVRKEVLKIKPLYQRKCKFFCVLFFFDHALRTGKAGMKTL